MKTNELISLLARNEPAAKQASDGKLAYASVGVAILLAIAFVGLLLKMNPDIGSILGSLWFWVRFLYVASLAALAWWGLKRLMRPGVAKQVKLWPIAIPFLTLSGIGGALLLQAPPEARIAMLLGTTWRVCSMLIALTSIPLFVASVVLVRFFAPVRLRFTGAVLGLFSGAMAAVVYTLHCPELSPAFLVVWYSIGILIPALVGAALGDRLLRW